MTILDVLNSTQRAHAQTIVRYVASLGLPKRAGIIVCETALVESHFTIYANPNVLPSMVLTHEAVGTDHASVGIFQQQVPSWGTAYDCMDPVRSASKFLHGAGNNPGLLNLPGYRFAYVGYSGASNWSQIPTGSAAQAVQVSAFPGRYQEQEANATLLVNTYWPASAGVASAGAHLLTKEEPMIIIAAPHRGIAEKVPGGKYHLSPSEWTAIKDARTHGATVESATISAASWDALPEKRGKL